MPRGGERPKCKIEGCNKPNKARGMCPNHYELWKRNGDPLIKNRRDNGQGTLSKLNGKVTLINGKREKEYINVAEKALGKPLPKGSIVHHWDKDKLNSNPENLLICPDQTYHLLIHQRMRAYDACGHADWLICRYCGKYDDPKNLSVHKRAYHKKCMREYMRARKDDKS
jgi:hypothetical protein